MAKMLFSPSGGMADTLVLGTSVERRVSSSLTMGTKYLTQRQNFNNMERWKVSG